MEVQEFEAEGVGAGCREAVHRVSIVLAERRRRAGALPGFEVEAVHVLLQSREQSPPATLDESCPDQSVAVA